MIKVSERQKNDDAYYDDKKYYYDVRVGLSKRIIAGILNKFLKPKFEQLFEGDPKQIYKQYLQLESLKF